MFEFDSTMFKKIMKGGQKKPSKVDVMDTGSGPGSNMTVNHSSRAGTALPAATSPVVMLPPRMTSVETLPLFRDVPVSERQGLFLRKLQLCCFQLDLSDNLKQVREKEIKRQTLLELVDLIQSGSWKITEVCQEEMIKMVGVNIFRSLPPAAHENTGQEPGDLEEEEPYMEPSWPHLQMVYELLLRYMVSSDTDTKVAKKHIDHSFVLKLLGLFDTEDPREREYLKTILHRIYGKFMVHRPFIRKAISNIFYRLIYEMDRHAGIPELLEILGSIINGFALPIKEEHNIFLVKALIPLHKPKYVGVYHQQLSYCILQFVEKDYKLADSVIKGLLKYWPQTNCQKEILFLGELEEVLEGTQSVEFQRCIVPLFRQIARCINSPHFQVAERTLFLWNNEHIVGLTAQHRHAILPIIFEALEKNLECHWNQAVHGLTVNVRKMFLEMDPELFGECQKQFADKVAKASGVEEQREKTWKRLEDVALKRGGHQLVMA